MGWNHPVLRPCENYLYAFISIKDYGDNPLLMSLAVDFHALLKFTPKSSSPPSMEAYLAGQEGVKDAVNNKNWKAECENGIC